MGNRPGALNERQVLLDLEVLTPQVSLLPACRPPQEHVLPWPYCVASPTKVTGMVAVFCVLEAAPSGMSGSVSIRLPDTGPPATPRRVETRRRMAVLGTKEVEHLVGAACQRCPLCDSRGGVSERRPLSLGVVELDAKCLEGRAVAWSWPVEEGCALAWPALNRSPEHTPIRSGGIRGRTDTRASSNCVPR